MADRAEFLSDLRELDLAVAELNMVSNENQWADSIFERFENAQSFSNLSNSGKANKANKANKATYLPLFDLMTSNVFDENMSRLIRESETLKRMLKTYASNDNFVALASIQDPSKAVNFQEHANMILANARIVRQIDPDFMDAVKTKLSSVFDSIKYSLGITLQLAGDVNLDGKENSMIKKLNAFSSNFDQSTISVVEKVFFDDTSFIMKKDSLLNSAKQLTQSISSSLMSSQNNQINQNSHEGFRYLGG